MTTSTLPSRKRPASAREPLDSVVVRFAGDSGDGIQLTGNRFAAVTALPATISPPFPIFRRDTRRRSAPPTASPPFRSISAREIKTSGDAPDVLVALNPAALKVELPKLKQGGIVIIDTGSFNERNLRKAGYAGATR